MKRKWYTIFVVAAGCIALALGFILFRLKYGGWKELEIELMKDLIQLSLIIIAGGVLVHEYTLDRDDQKKLYELKKELYFSMTASYFKVKKIRRILEAGVKNKNRPADRKMSYATYATLMLELNDAQLEYEAHREQLSFFINSGGFSNKEFGEELKENVRVIEKNLNEIVTMYQDSEPETSEVNVSGIELLDKFIFNTGHFKAKISDHHHRNIKLFLSELRRLKEVPEYPDDKSLSPDLSGASAQGVGPSARHA